MLRIALPVHVLTWIRSAGNCDAWVAHNQLWLSEDVEQMTDAARAAQAYFRHPMHHSLLQIDTAAKRRNCTKTVYHQSKPLHQLTHHT
jgi:hypothetical protein